MSHSAPSGSRLTYHDSTPGIQRLRGKRAPYWKGARAELIVAERVTRYASEKKSKRTGRARARREKTPQQQLRRLERALARRKTLAARQRIAAQIKQLKKELSHAT